MLIEAEISVTNRLISQSQISLSLFVLIFKATKYIKLNKTIANISKSCYSFTSSNNFKKIWDKMLYNRLLNLQTFVEYFWFFLLIIRLAVRVVLCFGQHMSHLDTFCISWWNYFCGSSDMSPVVSDSQQQKGLSAKMCQKTQGCSITIETCEHS